MLMTPEIPEREWKYLRSIESAMLESLYNRINNQAYDIFNSPHKSERDKFKALYKHVMDSNDIVADCFDDWRRSTIIQKILFLRRHHLLTDEHVANLTEDTRERIKMWEAFSR